MFRGHASAYDSRKQSFSAANIACSQFNWKAWRMKSTADIHEAATSRVETLMSQHHKIIGAMKNVMCMYYENRADGLLLEALDELIECTRDCFSVEETHKPLIGGAEDAKLLEEHEAIINQMTWLRQSIERAEPRHLLAQLISIDHGLTAYVSNEILTLLRHQPGSVPILEEATHHDSLVRN